MIRVELYTKDSVPVGFRMSGHAGYRKAGKDIVCASASVLAINTVNAIGTFTDDDFDYSTDDGYLYLLITSGVSEESKLLLNALKLGLTAIYEEYSKHLEIQYKEV